MIYVLFCGDEYERGPYHMSYHHSLEEAIGAFNEPDRDQSLWGFVSVLDIGELRTVAYYNTGWKDRPPYEGWTRIESRG